MLFAHQVMLQFYRLHAVVNRCNMHKLPEGIGSFHFIPVAQIADQTVHITGAGSQQRSGVVLHNAGRTLNSQDLTFLHQGHTVAKPGFVHIRR